MSYLLFALYPVFLFFCVLYSARNRKMLHAQSYFAGFLQWSVVYVFFVRASGADWSTTFIRAFPWVNPGEGLLLSGIAVAFVLITLLWQNFEKRIIEDGHVLSWKVLASLLIGSSVPVFISYWYHAGFSSGLFLFGYLIVNLLYYIRHVTGKRIFSGIVLFFLLAVLGMAAFTGIIVTPLSAFLAWFEIVKSENAGGLVPLLFAVTGGFFSSVFGGLTYEYGYRGPLTGVAVTLFFLLALINQSILYVLFAFLFLFAGCIWLVMYRSSVPFRKAIPSVSFVVGISLCVSILPGLLHRPQGNAYVDEVLSPSFRSMVIRMFPDFPFLYSMSGYGYTFSQKRVGGKPALSKRTVFTVEAPRSSALYLRGEVYDVYTGSGWERTSDLSESGDGYDRFFSRNENHDEEDPAFTIRIMTDFFNYLPHTLDAHVFDSSRNTVRHLKSGSIAEGFILRNPLLHGDTLSVYTSSESADPGGPDDLYLQVPDDLPFQVRELALQLGSGINNEPEKILSNIETYLSQNNQYSLEVDKYPGEAVDASWDFLFNSKTGYCTHFATAYVLLSRLNGIPARYVTGFLVYMPRDRDVAEVSGLSAHSWPEVWREGKGWTTREATPPMNPDVRADYLYYGNYLSGGGYTARQLGAILENLGFQNADQPQVRNADGKRRISGSFILLFLMACLLIAGGIVFVPRLPGFLSGSRREEMFKRMMSRVVTHYETAGFPGPSLGGWKAWYDRILEAQPENTVSVSRVYTIAVRCFYSGKDIRDLDRKYLRVLVGRGL